MCISTEHARTKSAARLFLDRGARFFSFKFWHRMALVTCPCALRFRSLAQNGCPRLGGLRALFQVLVRSCGEAGEVILVRSSLKGPCMKILQMPCLRGACMKAFFRRRLGGSLCQSSSMSFFCDHLVIFFRGPGKKILVQVF